MKSYIGILTLVLGLLLSYGIAWHLDSDSPPERPSRRLLDNRSVGASDARPQQAEPCSSPGHSFPASAGTDPVLAAEPHQPELVPLPTMRPDAEPQDCEVGP